MVNTIEGLAETQQELAAMAMAARGDRGLRNSLILALAQLHRYATGIVHVDTGRLKNSLFWTVQRADAGSVSGIVATNVEYAQEEHNRGGADAFFARTVREEGARMNSMFATSMRNNLR